MKVVGYVTSQPIDKAGALQDLDLPKPAPGPHDLLVKVAAISVNPVDCKVRQSRQGSTGAPVVLGWDAVGTVEAVGAAVSLFKPGDEVFYAGDINRPGSNAEYQLVDERITGRKPRKLDAISAAALPLTALTAYEMLFDRLAIARRGNKEANGLGRKLLIIGGAGGVGSIAHIFGNAQAQGSAGLAAGKALDGFIIQGQQSASISQQQLAVAGQGQAAAGPDEDLPTEKVFQLADLDAHSGLAATEQAAGSGEAAGLGDSDKGPQAFEVEICIAHAIYLGIIWQK